jgi:hypothetical protein
MLCVLVLVLLSIWCCIWCTVNILHMPVPLECCYIYCNVHNGHSKSSLLLYWFVLNRSSLSFSCVSYVASFFGMSIFGCTFGILWCQFLLHLRYSLTIISKYTRLLKYCLFVEVPNIVFMRNVYTMYMVFFILHLILMQCFFVFFYIWKIFILYSKRNDCMIN